MKTFEEWSVEHNFLTLIGKMAVFYVPVNKVEPHKKDIHKFLIRNYGAYTHEKSDIEGFWGKGKRIIKDKNERYEVSFQGKDKVFALVEFLAELCKKMDEDAIYLTMGDRSYLVKPN